MAVGSKSGKELMSKELLEEESFAHLASSEKVLMCFRIYVSLQLCCSSVADLLQQRLLMYLRISRSLRMSTLILESVSQGIYTLH